MFPNGSHTLVTTDETGHAVARGLRPNSASGQFQIHVNASYQGRTTSKNISQTNAILTAAGTVAGGAGHGKLIAVLAGLGAAAAGGIVYATQRGGSSPTTPTASSPTTISAGS